LIMTQMIRLPLIAWRQTSCSARTITHSQTRVYSIGVMLDQPFVGLRKYKHKAQGG